MNFEKGKLTKNQWLPGIEGNEGADTMQIKREHGGARTVLHHNSGGKDMTVCILRTVHYKEQVLLHVSL